MQNIGFSHGVLYRVLDVYSKKAIDIYKNCNNDVIEICCNKSPEADKLASLVGNICSFKYKSIHLPTDIEYKNNSETLDLLDKISTFYRDTNANIILIHPDTVSDWKVFDQYKLNWAIENMDNRKEKYKTPNDIKNFFAEKPDWKLILDLNHCYSNDASMKIADDFIKNFKNNISQIHLSGYESYHEPLFQTKQNNILDYCKLIDVPIIIESTFDAIDDVKREYEYITNYLNK